MSGDGVAMVEVTIVGVAVRNLGRAAVVEGDGQAIIVQGDDPADVAVRDAEGAVVPSGDDSVADGEAPFTGLDLLDPECSGVAQAVAGALVQIGDVAATKRDHQRPFASLMGLPPVLDERVARCRGGRGGHQAPVVVVLAGEVSDIAAAQRRECLAVPLLLLATNVMELRRAHAIGQCPKGTASGDLRQLPVVTDEDELRFGPRGSAARSRVPTVPASSTTSTAPRCSSVP
jgi:hypothetical protein